MGATSGMVSSVCGIWKIREGTGSKAPDKQEPESRVTDPPREGVGSGTWGDYGANLWDTFQKRLPSPAPRNSDTMQRET